MDYSKNASQNGTVKPGIGNLELNKSELMKYNQNELVNRLLLEIENNQKYRFELSNLNKRLTNSEKERQFYKVMVNEKSQQYKKLQAIQNNNSKKIEQLQSEIIVRSRLMLADESKYWQDKYNELNKYMQIYTKQVSDMQEQFSLKHKKLTQSNLVKSKQIQILYEKLNNVQLKRKEEEQGKQKYRKQIQRIQQRNKDLQFEIKNIQKKYKQVVQQCKQVMNQYKKCHQNNKFLKQKMEKIQLNNKQNLQIIQNNQNKIKLLQKHLDDALNQIHQLNHKFKQAIQLDIQVNASLQSLNQQNTSLRHQHDQIILIIDQKNKIITNLQQINNKIIQQAQLFRKNNLEKQVKSLRLQKNLQQLQQQLNTKNQQIQALSSLLKNTKNQTKSNHNNINDNPNKNHQKNKQFNLNQFQSKLQKNTSPTLKKYKPNQAQSEKQHYSATIQPDQTVRPSTFEVLSPNQLSKYNSPKQI